MYINSLDILIGCRPPSVHPSYIVHYITMHMTNLSSTLPGLPSPFLHIASTQTWDGGEDMGQRLELTTTVSHHVTLIYITNASSCEI